MTNENAAENSEEPGAEVVAARTAAVVLFSWRAWPAVERPQRAVFAGLIVSAAGLGSGSFAMSSGGTITEGVVWGCGAVVLLMLSLANFFFRSRYEIDAEGIWARYPLRRKRLRWVEVRRFAHDVEGGFLSTRARASRMDAFRGMHLRFGNSGEEVVKQIEARRKESRATARRE